MSPREPLRTAARVAQGGGPRRSPRRARNTDGVASAATNVAAPTLPEAAANGPKLIATVSAMFKAVVVAETIFEPPPLA